MKLAGRGVPCSLACQTVSFEERHRVESFRAWPQCGVISPEGSSSSAACCLFCARPNPPFSTSLKTSNIIQARAPLCLEYTGARDLVGCPVIEDGLARVSALRSARKRVCGMKQQRPLRAVLGVNDLGPHDNALCYSVTENTDGWMFRVSVRLTLALKAADLVRWLVRSWRVGRGVVAVLFLAVWRVQKVHLHWISRWTDATEIVVVQMCQETYVHTFGSR